MTTTTLPGAHKTPVPPNGPRHHGSSATSAAGRRRRERVALLPTAALILGALYTLAPIFWVLTSATKSPADLFSTVPFVPGSDFLGNVADLSRYEGGRFWLWAANSLLYAGGGAALSTAVSAAAGYALARFRFRGRGTVFTVLLGAVMIPQVALAMPQYFLVSGLGLTNTYWAVLLPSVISPFGIYLACIYAQGSVPLSTLEAARMDGAGEFRTFRSVAAPMMLPGLVTVFMLQFVGIWNNFLLPFIMLSDEHKFPLTLGLYLMLNRGSSAPALYTLAITGALLAIVPLVALMMFLQRYWRVDLLSGGVKG
ncbi:MULTISPECIES: carbohydrate ABC transporter permease [unclassified Streptomyces]|uniref:carbohydrate ABC transporter permease n=1 Tax=unclassified Streptomyces TaxID=2593676 RepID=UPI00278C367D|nr:MULTISPECIES: carbohydrate ABC transporter permease [unclassified Streptomyces]